MNSQPDSQLLRIYADGRTEAAFAELARRHVDFVYSAALRMVRDSHLAEDVTQGVFVALAKNAGQLAGRPVISGWLHRTAQNIAAQTVRTIERRRAREQEAALMNTMPATESETSWETIAPQLDAALGELSEADRDALLLRYFEKKSAPEMAGILGISDEAAQKRVGRAVERLRQYFSKRKVTIGAGGVVALISANAVQSAPVGLIATVCTAAIAATAVTTSTAIAITKTIAMTALQKTFVAVTVAALAGAEIYEARQAAQLREQNQTLRQQQAPLTEQIAQLQRERDEATAQQAAGAEQMRISPADKNELLKLRGEVGALRQQLATQPAAPVKPLALIPVGDPVVPDAVEQLERAIEGGDSTALGKLGDYAKAQASFFRTNSAGLKGDALEAAWVRAFGGLMSAFESLEEAAVKGNVHARDAITRGIHVSSLQMAAIPALGRLAGAGDETALQILLDPERNGLQLSSTVDALEPAAASGNERAIAALTAILANEKKKALWFMASKSLQRAADSGNAAALAALNAMPPGK